jgi:hypothetical protein
MEFVMQRFLPDDRDRPLTIMSATVDSVTLAATQSDFKLWLELPLLRVSCQCCCHGVL